MISSPIINTSTIDFLQVLKQSKFQGDIEDSYGARIVASTDNSVYQVIPHAIIYPKIGDDINTLVTLISKHVEANPVSKLSIVARGGGTGTNGQSLNESLILDTSRYLNKIIELDEKSMQVTVEPGVVLDQLNAFLGEHNLFFPPDVSSSSRATLGGMVATDASGKGSRIYGKTSDYIQSLDVVLSDGSDFKIEEKKYKSALKGGGGQSNVLKNRAEQKVFEVIDENKEEIENIFPSMNRGLTGYNLEHVLGDDGQFKLAYLLAGSEGTLALTKQITLRVIKKPKFRALVAVFYDDFDNTLEHVTQLLKAEPTAIEVLDDKILQIAQQDAIWQDVEASFTGISLTGDIKGLNFIEVTADSKSEIEKQCQSLNKIIETTGADFGVITQLIEKNSKTIASLWNIRKRSVGLLAALEGERRAIAFVEDCAVPPEKLPAFIKDFRKILDSHGLAYGMYGHADVGCLHVRPTLNMKQETDQKLLRTITDQVALLAKEYGGLLWGEHGRGYRGEYSPLFFGEQLYPLLREIKAVFDPHNIFNPGKLATPIGDVANVTAIDNVPFRGQFDAQILDKQANEFKTAMLCNGNAACFSWDASEAMCPSYKATKDKRQSPKGRASMLREWLRLSSDAANTNTGTLASLENELYESLNTCLSCKSCTHSCPIKVDVPELKSKFLAHYHSHEHNAQHNNKHKRKISDSLFASFEATAKIGRTLPSVANAVLQNTLTKQVLEKGFGIINSPKFSRSLTALLKERQASFIQMDSLPEQSENTVILLPDSFNASYDSQIIIACYDVLNALGYKVLVAPILENGKVLHVKGYRKKFKQIAEKHTAQMKLLDKIGLPLISVEVVTRLMHSKEYPEICDTKPDYKVWSIEAWLSKELENKPDLQKRISQLSTKTNTKENNETSHKLLPHCMEQTADKLSAIHWQTLFSAFQISLKIENAGCCGMSGLFGHEKGNQQLSETIYQQSWQAKVADEGMDIILASGFSCRCQLHNHGKVVNHPIEILASSFKYKTSKNRGGGQCR